MTSNLSSWKAGVYTALITPFAADSSLDTDGFRALLKRQIDAGVSGVILWGSTGEGLLLTEAEKLLLLHLAQEGLRGIADYKRPRLILNVGGSCTADMVAWVRKLSSEAYDGVMVVTPPYVKPPVEGIVAHLNSISFCHKPVMLYSIPARTGRALSADEIGLILERCPNVTAIKESSGSLNILRELRTSAYVQDGKSLSDRVALFVGDDPLYLAALQERLVIGVVSVISNAIPQTWQQLSTNDVSVFETVDPIFKIIVSVPNPIGIKHALLQLGRIQTDVCRLPLLPYSQCVNAHGALSPQKFTAAVKQLESFP